MIKLIFEIIIIIDEIKIKYHFTFNTGLGTASFLGRRFPFLQESLLFHRRRTFGAVAAAAVVVVVLARVPLKCRSNRRRQTGRQSDSANLATSTSRAQLKTGRRLLAEATSLFFV